MGKGREVRLSRRASRLSWQTLNPVLRVLTTVGSRWRGGRDAATSHQELEGAGRVPPGAFGGSEVLAAPWHHDSGLQGSEGLSAA